MQYAFVNGVRQEPEPKLRGSCPNCGADVIAKCGQKRAWYWSHLGKLECDRWWEPETEWHRAWKALFPQEWQEVIHVAADGERHIADVKNDRGLVIEFQHSPLDPEERRSRENFYERMVWVVDGMRYKRDLSAFRKALAEGIVIRENPLWLVPLGGAAALRQRWAPLKCPVFIDFGGEDFHIAGLQLPENPLWQFLWHPTTREFVIAPVTRESFIKACLNGSEFQYLSVIRPQVRLQRPQGRYLRISRKHYIRY